jgi:hypothetical protein
MAEIQMKRTEPKFAVCVKNEGYAASLELRRLYQVVSDEAGAKLGQIRVIDESGEGYLYPEAYFVMDITKRGGGDSGRM